LGLTTQKQKKNMKKLLIVLLAVSSIVATSCKKDNEIVPVKTGKTVKVMNDKGNIGTWD
jgi:hypothetical protein